ncbi:MAG TPA: peptidyl-alpha-hydroxyglycine alpha-amidating lyase family protein [Longimicrobiales bacterium]|nr:peptidyl-alpha-hydroxyglycine alpha-amidating lyase family protein [Longimicrobiales bacterium]
MSNRCRKALHLPLLAATLAALAPASASSQTVTYELVPGWAELPEGIERFGMTLGLELDGEQNLWVFQRCFSTDCVDGPEERLPAVLKYDAGGRLLDSWGEGMFVWPHGFYLDAEGNVWTSDARGAGSKGHTVMKHAPDGRVLMTLGTPGVPGAGEDTFDGPADVLVAPDGSVFVADGHGNNRVVKFSEDGEFLMEWGTEGTLLGQFNEPHALAMDSRGRLFVADRMNQRIQVFDQEGRFLAVWPAIQASGLHIAPGDIVYVADYQLREGIVIARASDFEEIGFIDGTLAEGVTVDPAGHVYTGESIPRNVKKFERRVVP